MGITLGQRSTVPPLSNRVENVREALLACGVASSALYAAMLIITPFFWPEYSSASQTVSELSAIGAPTRPLWVPLGVMYTLLIAAFGRGVWMSATESRALRVVGGALIVYGIVGVFWPPMHLRGMPFTLTDALHIVWAAVTVLLMLIAIGFGAAAFGKRFRVYSIATMVVLAVCGALTSLQAPNIAANGPTPLIGVWERINIATFLVWVVVLTIVLVRPAPLASDAGLNRRFVVRD